MKRYSKIGVFLLLLIAIIAILTTAAKDVDTIPDVKGVWEGKGNSVIFGKLNHYEKKEPVKFSSLKFTYDIVEQEGRLFHGKRFSVKHSEDIVGYIGMNNKSIFIADHDGYMQGEILEDGSICLGYLEAGVESRVAALATYTRK